MDEKKSLPFGLNSGRITLLIMGALALLITLSMSMGGLHTYGALKEASNAAKQATPAQLQSTPSQ